jgi:hypothetical protein
MNAMNETRWRAVAASVTTLPLLMACGPYRSIDGSDNNLRQLEYGKAGSQLQRSMVAAYGDGIWTMAGQELPSPRRVSNAVCDQDSSIPNGLGASDFVWQWGQFLDHDIDLTPGAVPLEPTPIGVPEGDPFFDPFHTGFQTIAFSRSMWDPESGTGLDNPRQQVNRVTAFIDGSNVYGSDVVRAATLRKNDGSGELQTSSGDLLPFNLAGLPNAGGDGTTLFLAGDIRANEQVGLTAMHTLFLREHNRIARRLRQQLPHLSGEDLYQAARKLVGAEIQAITFREYLPALLGPYTPSLRGRYRPSVDPQIMNHFSTALFRYGHSQLNSHLLRNDERGDEIPAGDLPLRDAFFNPGEIVAHGIAPVLRGLASQTAQAVDVFVIDDVRNFLFGPPGSGGFDLASLNIQRGRDHGMPSYNAARAAYGLVRADDYDDISSDPVVQQRLVDAYGSGQVDHVDLWVGGLAEDHLPGALVGELVTAALVLQFEALRDGDRFWYRRDLHPIAVATVERMSLHRIIRANTEIRRIQRDVFHVPAR